MKIVLIRHGEPDYSKVDEKGYIGFVNLAPLSQKGINQAEQVSTHKALNGSEIIISSPYTRALQTASIISKNTNLNINVEIDLHERLPDKDFKLHTKESVLESFDDYDKHKGIYSNLNTHYWECIDSQIHRIHKTLSNYLTYNKIIMVSHGELIRRLANIRLTFCGIIEIEYDDHYKFLEWS